MSIESWNYSIASILLSFLDFRPALPPLSITQFCLGEGAFSVRPGPPHFAICDIVTFLPVTLLAKVPNSESQALWVNILQVVLEAPKIRSKHPQYRVHTQRFWGLGLHGQAKTKNQSSSFDSN